MYNTLDQGVWFSLSIHIFFEYLFTIFRIFIVDEATLKPHF